MGSGVADQNTSGEVLLALKQAARKASEERNYAECWDISLRALSISPYDISLIKQAFVAESRLTTAQRQKTVQDARSFIASLAQVDDHEKSFKALLTALFYYSDFEGYLEHFDKKHGVFAADIDTSYWHATSLHAVGRLSEAAHAYTRIKDEKKYQLAVCRQLNLLYCQAGDHQSAFIECEREKQLTGSDAPHYDVMALLIAGRTGEAWKTYCHRDISRELGKKYSGVEALSLEKKQPRLVVLAEAGVGDEIRLSTLYKDLPLLAHEVIVSCDPRVYSLFCRSFPDLRFVPVNRAHNGIKESDIVPAAFRGIMSEALFESLGHTDIVVPALNLLSVLREPGSRLQDHQHINLVPDPVLVARWRQIFGQMSGIKIGLHQGTAIKSFNRLMNIFSLKDFSPILTAHAEDIIFVNLDHEAIDADTGAYNGICTPEGVDLKNDFENVAAILAVLDAVITPPNTMLDFCGAVGVKTISPYTTCDFDYRFSLANGGDIWFKSIRGVKGDSPGDRTSAIRSVSNALVSVV